MMVMKLRENERLEEFDHWIPTFARKQIGDDLQAASSNSLEWPHLVANGRKGGDF